jgi:putative addiction module component (TIGR02574 family)
MSMPQDQLFESALSLPQSQRAELAFQLLQSLEPPGDEVSPEAFGVELQERIASYRNGTAGSSSLEETRDIIRQRLLGGSGS